MEGRRGRGEDGNRGRKRIELKIDQKRKRRGEEKEIGRDGKEKEGEEDQKKRRV